MSIGCDRKEKLMIYQIDKGLYIKNKKQKEFILILIHILKYLIKQ